MYYFFKFIATFGFKFGVWVYIYFIATYQSMIAIGVFIVIDLLTALWRAKAQNEPITSKKLRQTVGKSVAYMLAIIVAHVFEQNFTLGIIPMLKIIAFFIATAEIKSIYENLGSVTGLDFWKLIKERLSGTQNNQDQNNNPQ